MLEGPWFPIKYELPNEVQVGRLLYSGRDWQIFEGHGTSRIIVVRGQLVGRWVESGFLPQSVFHECKYGDEVLWILGSESEHRLEPVCEWLSPKTKAEGLSFAISLRETRKIDPASPLHDAIYVERYSRLLPTWSISVAIPDDEVLGRWLTGGVSVSARSSRRLGKLLGWLETEDVHDLLVAAGPCSEDTFMGDIQRIPELPARSDSLKDGDSAELISQPTRSSFALCRSQFHLAGRSCLERFFNEHVIDIVMNPESYGALGIEFPSAIVLHGPPGCGKTYAVEKLLEFLDWPTFYIDANSVGSPYIHETGRKIGEIFDNAIDAAPAAIVIDEMESFLSDRHSQGASGLHHVEEVAEFLRRIPDASKRHILVIGMTNRLDMIDTAVLRRGRFDHIVEVGEPSERDVAELVKSLLDRLPLAHEVELAEIAHTLAGRPLSDTAFIVREAARLAARERRSALDETHLYTALESLPRAAPRKPRIGFIQD